MVGIELQDITVQEDGVLDLELGACRSRGASALVRLFRHFTITNRGEYADRCRWQGDLGVCCVSGMAEGTLKGLEECSAPAQDAEY
jgi:hypothetical protein